MYPKDFNELIEYFKKLPGIGEKSAERFALAVLDMSTDEVGLFSEKLVYAKNNLKPCSVCGQLTDKDVCDICLDKNRNQNLICVLEDYKSVFTFEKVGNYNGTYHVLNGLISPIDGINPEDINIGSLLERVKKLKNPELIIALKSSAEGEITTLYLKKLFEKENVKISRLSYGIPMGAEIDYMDATTLSLALDDRKEIS